MTKSFDIRVDLSTGAGVESPLINISGDDTLYYRFVSDGSSAPSTAVLSSYSHRHLNEPGLIIATVALDGTVGSFSLTGFEFVSFAVTTTEAAKRGTLYIQSRKTQE